MASESPVAHANGYTIFRPKKARVIDILLLLLLRRRRTISRVVESSSPELAAGDDADPWVIGVTLLIQKILETVKTPMAWTGIIIEFLVNFLALNGGILGLLWHIITVSVVIPRQDAANYRSFIGHIDGRLDFYKNGSTMNFLSLLMDPAEMNLGDIDPFELSMMAAKVSYENAAYVQDAVTNHWKMNFVGFYNCWNKFLKEKTTQAFIFTDKAKDANVIVLAFRGTEPFNAMDWSTDVDLSWLFTGKTGNIHLGFLKALGLQDEKSFQRGFPKDFNGEEDKPIAYYVIRQALRDLIKKHKNAKIIVTGHSLGGALAALFPVILSVHGESDILNATYCVMTFGQPRVGDLILGTYMSTIVRLNYYRMVYRFDIIPRIPFDVPPIAMFKHFGTCMYYDGWYKGQVMIGDSPNPNYFDPLYTFSMYLNAWGDLFKGMFIGFTQGKGFRESFVSILYRMSGILVPGIASHSPRDYLNSTMLAKTTNKIMV